MQPLLDADIRRNLLFSVPDRRCESAATVDCNARRSGDRSEPPGPLVYAAEAFAKRGRCSCRTRVTVRLSVYIAIGQRSDPEYHRDVTARETFLLLSDSWFRTSINRRSTRNRI